MRQAPKRKQVFFSFLLISIALIVTIFNTIVLLFHIPFYQSVPAWVYGFRQLPTVSIAAILMNLAAVAYLIYFAIRNIGPRWYHIFFLICASIIIQFSMTGIDGRFQSSMREQLMKPDFPMSHAQFAISALRMDKSLLELISGYDEILLSKEYTQYAEAKPPGFLSFYLIHKKITQFVLQPKSLPELYFGYANLAIWIWPALASLAILPLYFLGKTIAGHKAAQVACIFYILTPSVNLIGMHLDQFLLPGIFLLTIYIAWRGFERKNYIWIICAGLLSALGLFISFAMLAILTAVAVAAFYALDKRRSKLFGSRNWSIVSLSGIYLLSIIGIFYIFYYLFDYDHLNRFQEAIATHKQWKDVETQLFSSTEAMSLNIC